MRIDFLTWIPDEKFENLLKRFPNVKRVTTLEELINSSGDFLLSFGTSVIVPENVIARYSLGAVNIHGASPEFPGRDPHHWACYARTETYGATAHLMTKNVDAGEIIDVEISPVNPDSSPLELLEIGNSAGYSLITRILSRVDSGSNFASQSSYCWGQNKKTRQDFFEITTISRHLEPDELENRFRAFSHPNFNNFRIQESGFMKTLTNQEVLDFISHSKTEDDA